MSRPAIAPNVVADVRGTFQWNFPYTGYLTNMINLKPRLDAPRVHDDKELFVLQCVPDSTKENKKKKESKICSEADRNREDLWVDFKG